MSEDSLVRAITDDICEMQIEKRYGDAAIKVLSKDLQNIILEAKGLTSGGLYYCKRFYLLYNQLFEKVPQLGLAQIRSLRTPAASKASNNE